MGNVIGFGLGRTRISKPGWSNQEIAEFYRVESALARAGMTIQIERGLGDEGDPWLAFCHGGSGEVIVHFARIDGEYVVDAPALSDVLRGGDLTRIVKHFVSDNPVSLPNMDTVGRPNVVFHPAVLLTIFVATMLILDMPAKGLASEMEGSEADGEHGLDGQHHYASLANSREMPVHDDDRGSSEKAFLIAAITMAAGMVDVGIQNGDILPAGAPTHDGGLPEASQGAAPDPGHDARGDLFGLSNLDFISGDHSREGEAHVPGAASRDVEASTAGMVALRESVPEHGPAPQEIDVAGLDAKVQAHPETSERTGGLIQRSAPMPAVESASAEHEAGAESGSGQQAEAAATGVAATPAVIIGAAGNWLAQAAADAGWSLNVVDGQDTNAREAVEIVDRGDLVEPKVNQPADPADAGHAAIVDVIGAFLASDDDIDALARSDNSRVLFDRSDVADGHMLEMHSWAFDDGTTIAILGHADTMDHVFAAVA